jgi:hypothetical protein
MPNTFACNDTPQSACRLLVCLSRTPISSVVHHAPVCGARTVQLSGQNPYFTPRTHSLQSSGCSRRIRIELRPRGVLPSGINTGIVQNADGEGCCPSATSRGKKRLVWHHWSGENLVTAVARWIAPIVADSRMDLRLLRRNPSHQRHINRQNRNDLVVTT